MEAPREHTADVYMAIGTCEPRFQIGRKRKLIELKELLPPGKGLQPSRLGTHFTRIV